MRYLTPACLLGAAPDAPELQEARRAIMTDGAVPRILAEQQADGHWEELDRSYPAKCRGAVWTALFVTELGAGGGGARIPPPAPYGLIPIASPLIQTKAARVTA